jgi:PAS domain S-box-containing protein
MLTSAKEALRYLSNSKHFHVIAVDADGRYIFLSDSYLKKYHHLPTSCLGGISLESIIEEDRQKCVETTIKCSENPGKPVHVVLRKSDGNGGFFWTEWDFILETEYAEGEIIIGLGYDVSNYELLEQQNTKLSSEVQESHEKLKEKMALLQTAETIAKIGSWKFDVTSNVLSWSDETSAIHGLSKEDNFRDFNVANPVDFYHESYRPAIICAFQNCIKNGTDFNIISKFTNKQGVEKWVRACGIPSYTDGKVKAIYGTIQDITLQQENSILLEKQNSHLRDIAFLQSHILRHPVVNILSIIELLNLSDLTQEQADYFELIRKETARLDEIIKTIVNKSAEIRF